MLLKKYPSRFFSPVTAALLGSAFFFAIYGYKILNPVFIEWAMHGDAVMTFLGWHFFRSEPWHFPIGLIQSYNYPQGTSIVYTDSIPLMAFLLKPFSPLLPGHFQYLGIWLLLSYMLQGIFGWYLVSRFIKNRCVAFIGTLFFVMSPVIVHRVELHHSSLTAQWVLLAAIYLFFETDTFTSRIKWLILLLATSMIHFYLLVMVGFIYGGYILRNLLLLEKKRVALIIPFPIITVFLLWVAAWVQGYFIINLQHASEFGFGKFSMNMLAPINPYPFSSFLFLKPFLVATAGQYEGFNYLGLGLILLTVIAGVELIRHKDFFKSKHFVPLFIVCLIFIGLALSNKIFLANHEIFHITLPHVIYWKLGLIRASGRMFWPVTYMVTLTCLLLVARYKSNRNAAIIISFAVLIQLVDFYPFFRNISLDNFSWETPLHSKLWGQFAKKYNHVVCVPALINKDIYIPFALYAGDCGMTINVASMARSDLISKKQYLEEQKNHYAQGHFQNNTLYIFLIKSTISDYVKSDSLVKQVVSIVDGYPIIAP